MAKVSNNSWLGQYLRLGLAVYLSVLSVISGSKCDSFLYCFALCASAQIVPDKTLGVENSVVTPVEDNLLPVDRIDGGAARGANLFHSFREFNINEGRAAYFTNPVGIENILSRVTGSNHSKIFGTLGVLGSANLFLINPNGIIFGPKAALNLNGSFVASTATRLKFADGTQFNAKNPQALPLLTVSVPIGLQLEANAGDIVNQSQFNLSGVSNNFGSPIGLLVQPKKTLALVGGEVRLEGGNLTAPGGRIELGSVAGLVSLTPTNKGWTLGYQSVQNFHDIQLSRQATVNTSSEGGGNIQLTGRRVALTEGSRVISFTLGAQPAGQLIVNASDSVELTGTGTFVQDVQLFSTGALDPSQLRNGFFSANFASGGAGDITINTRKFVANNGAFVTTSTFGQGSGANLSVNATDSVELTASALGTGTGIGNAGDAGDLTINTKKLTAQDNALVSTSSLGQGQGGTITVNASDAIELTGSTPIPIQGNTFVNTSLISGTRGTGVSGDVRVKTGRLILRDGAQLSATTLDQGSGGNIQFAADSLSLTNGAALISLSIGQGNAGNISGKIRGRLQVDNGTILANSEQSSGGDINITAEDIRLTGDSDIRTNVASADDAGNITLISNSIIAFDDSDILAAARDGKGGNITLDTPAFFGFNYRSNVVTNTFSNNGKVDINATGVVSGTVSLPDVSFLQNSLNQLPENLINTNTLIANICITRSRQKQSSFIITGAGSLPNRPEDTVSQYPTGTVRPVSGDNNSSSIPATHKTRSWQIGDPIIEPQGMYRLADRQLVLSRECI